MILKKAIKKFLSRKLRDCNLYKNLTKDQLQERMELLPIKPPIWYKLKQHQQACFLLGAKYRRIYYANDTGTGKSYLSIALIKYFIKLGEIKCALVLVPNKINKYEWAQQIAIHSPKTRYCILEGSSQEKWDILAEDDYDIVIATYMGFVRMVSDLVSTKKGKTEKKKLVPNLKKLKEVSSRIDGLIMDEITISGCKNYGTLPFRICRQIAKSSSVVFGLSGTPFGKDPTDLWAQMYLIDNGESLGPTLGLFRAAFFTTKKNYWGGFEYDFKPKMQSTLQRMFANRSIRYEVNATELPKLIPIIKEVKLPFEAHVYLDKAKKIIEESYGDFTMMKNAFLQMRQISSGFIGYYDDDEGIKAKLEFPYKPKLESLISVIVSIDPKYKIIVFYEYNFSADIISRELNQLGIKYVRIWSGTKDHKGVLQKFNTDPDYQVMLLQNAAGSGLNLQFCKYGLYFESPISPIMRIQTRRRFERQHSEHDCVFQYDFVALGTYDKRILHSLQEGKDLFDVIVNRKRDVPASKDVQRVRRSLPPPQ